MISVQPEVYLLSQPSLIFDALSQFLEDVGADDWKSTSGKPAEVLPEVAGRMCYRSWKPGLNPNVTKVRADNYGYIGNILKSGHGSVLEHVQTVWIFRNVSRVFTHELVRHRAGCGYSQESLRFVRLDDLPFWFPEWASKDEELMSRCLKMINLMEEHQDWMAKRFRLDEEGVPMKEKKHKTSFMRRFAPIGTATSILLSANIRALRHIIEMRTSEAAEEEIRLVFLEVAKKAMKSWPSLFQDMSIDVETGVCSFGSSKV